MSVVVRGMEMPEKCSECKFFRVYNRLYCTAVVGYTTVSKPRERRPTWCPLVDLGKHGDLIDRDKVIPKLNFINEAEHQIYGRASWGFTAKCIHAFDDAPTVIEAEDGT